MTKSHTHHTPHHARGNSHESASPLAHDLEELKDGVSQIGTDVSDLAQTAIHAGQSGVAAVQDLAGKAVEGVTGAIADGVNGLTATSQKTVKSVTRQMAEHPVASALVAMGAGFILAKFLRRK